MIARLLDKLFPKYRRLEVRVVMYREADALLKAGWRLAKEEDSNRMIGVVWLERVERVWRSRRTAEG